MNNGGSEKASQVDLQVRRARFYFTPNSVAVNLPTENFIKRGRYDKIKKSTKLY